MNVGKHNNNGVGIDPEVEKTVKNFTKSNKSLEGAFQGRSTQTTKALKTQLKRWKKSTEFGIDNNVEKTSTNPQKTAANLYNTSK